MSSFKWLRNLATFLLSVIQLPFVIEGWISYLEKLLYKYRIEKVKKVVPGGATGQLSIYNGLKAAKEIAGYDV